MIGVGAFTQPKRPTVVGLDTVEQALAALESAVAVRGGDYIYPHHNGACHYVDSQPTLTPSCLIGLVLHRAGVPLEWFIAQDPCGSDRNHLSARLACQDLDLDPDIGEILWAAQKAQDDGSSWAIALGCARARASHLHEDAA